MRRVSVTGTKDSITTSLPVISNLLMVVIETANRRGGILFRGPSNASRVLFEHFDFDLISPSLPFH